MIPDPQKDFGFNADEVGFLRSMIEETKLKMLAVGVVLVLVTVVVFVFQRHQPRNLGKLVVYKQAVVGSDFVVLLRWQRPDEQLTIEGNLFGKDETGTLWKVRTHSIMSVGPDFLKQECTLIAPSNSPPRWFVETEILGPRDDISKVFFNARMSLESKSLRPFREDFARRRYRTIGTVRSDYITNAVPRIDIKDPKR